MPNRAAGAVVPLSSRFLSRFVSQKRHGQGVAQDDKGSNSKTQQQAANSLLDLLYLHLSPKIRILVRFPCSLLSDPAGAFPCAVL